MIGLAGISYIVMVPSSLQGSPDGGSPEMDDASVADFMEPSDVGITEPKISYAGGGFTCSPPRISGGNHPDRDDSFHDSLDGMVADLVDSSMLDMLDPACRLSINGNNLLQNLCGNMDAGTVTGTLAPTTLDYKGQVLPAVAFDGNTHVKYSTFDLANNAGTGNDGSFAIRALVSVKEGGYIVASHRGGGAAGFYLFVRKGDKRLFLGRSTDCSGELYTPETVDPLPADTPLEIIATYNAATSRINIHVNDQPYLLDYASSGGQCSILQLPVAVGGASDGASDSLFIGTIARVEMYARPSL